MIDHPRKIFIVEDEVLIAFEMTDMLEDLGFEVVGPSVHVDDAKDIAKSAEMDAAFLDVNLGKNVTSQPVAEILKARGVPFVFVTAYDANHITFRTSDDQILRKPVTSNELLKTLRKVLPEHEQPLPK